MEEDKHLMRGESDCSDMKPMVSDCCEVVVAMR